MIIIYDSNNNSLQTDYYDWYGFDLYETYQGTISGLNAGNYFLYAELVSISHSVFLDSIYVPFTINSDTSENFGFCSFDLEIYPGAVYASENISFSWSMSGDIPEEIGFSIFSTAPGQWNVNLQYHNSVITDNDGLFTYTTPAGLNPDRDYFVYLDSQFQQNSSSVHCWKYGSFDILEVNEDPIDDIIDEIFDDIFNTVDKTPRISMWHGKVNQHNENGTWMTDPDGTAGAGNYAQWGSDGWGDRKLEYCQRFWPDTVDVVLRDTSEEIIFFTRGNQVAYLTTKPVWECVRDSDGDGILDPDDDDDDNDGWVDLIEIACLSDKSDANSVPIDSDNNGICDAVQDLIIEIITTPTSICSSSGAIENGIRGQPAFTDVEVVEKTSLQFYYYYEINDDITSNPLNMDIQQNQNNADFTGYKEYYDVFISDEQGNYADDGGYITIQAYTNLNTQNRGVGFNIDSIALITSDGQALYASEIVSVSTGSGLNNYTDGGQGYVLGQTDNVVSYLGNGETSITVGFCADDNAVSEIDEIENGDEDTPSISLIATLAIITVSFVVISRRPEE